MVFAFRYKKERYCFVIRYRLKFFLKQVLDSIWQLYLQKILVLKKGIKLYRLISFLEAISFIVLLCIAMPLKYIWEMPQMVQIVGMAHGVLFILYIIFSIYAWRVLQWSLQKLFIAIACSVLPFGPFYVDRHYL